MDFYSFLQIFVLLTIKKIKIVKMGGYEFKIVINFPPDDYEREIISGGLLHEKSFTFFVEYIKKMKPESKVLDIGANIGLYSLTAASLGLKTIAVEMVSKNYNLLNFSKRINYFSYLKTLNCAISDKEGQIYFSGQGAWASVTKNSNNQNLSQRSHAVVLDSIFQNEIKFIKMDIEGSELNALLGADLFLQSTTVDFMIECNVLACGKSGYSYTEILKLMKSFGFNGYRIGGHNILYSIGEFQEIVYTDYFFTKRSEDDLKSNFGFFVIEMPLNEIRSSILEQFNYGEDHWVYVYSIKDSINHLFPSDPTISDLISAIDYKKYQFLLGVLKVGS
jgi:FkbM family methyltransferase